MKKHSSSARRAGRAQTRPPPLEVETTVSQLVTPKLQEWLSDLSNAMPRVLANSDSEAVHDLRVSIRRIRSLLRIVRNVYGRFHVDAIRSEFARVADATGALRDEEVLAETLEALELDSATRVAIAPWFPRRAHRMKALRTKVVRLLQAGSLDPPREHLLALMKLPCDPDYDKEVRKFARQVVLDEQAHVERSRQADVTNVAGMHAHRIAYKRLRYAIEAFYQVLPAELRAWREVSSKFQSVLGRVHDHDVAMEVFRKAGSLGPEPRAVVVAQLAAQRDEIAAKYIEMSGQAEVVPPP